jgi:anti-sigma factor ChrR (cupin superfamily)
MTSEIASDAYVIPDLLTRACNADRAGFVPFREGIEILRIYGEGATGPAAALLRYQPGASVPHHRHADYEHIFVLEGSQRDEKGVYVAGTCVIHAPGTRHSVVSDDGCVVLAVWNQPVVFDAE